MNEHLRMQYLDALGIDMFVPRVILPNSAPLTQCELPVVIKEPGAQTLHDSSAPVRNLVAAISNAANSEPVSPKDRASERPPVSEIGQREVLPQLMPQETAAEAANEVAKFSLLVWRVSQNLLVIDSHEPGAALPTERLLTNMLIAAGLMTLNLPKAQPLMWPLPGYQGNFGWAAAREMVNEFIGTLLAEKPFQQLLLLGEHSQKLMVESAFEREPRESVLLAELSLKAYSLPSLADILRKPALKRIVWETLLVLKSAEAV